MSGRFEAELIDDVLVALQGGDGRLVRYASDSGDYELTLSGDERGFVEPRQCDLLLCILELATLHRRVLHDMSALQARSRSSVVAASVFAGVQKELVGYYQQVAGLQTLLDGQPASLLRLLHWTRQPLKAMTMLAALLSNLASVSAEQLEAHVHRHAQHGAPWAGGLFASLLCTVRRPLVSMLLRWCFAGEIELCDPFGEFFIRRRQSRALHSRRSNDTDSDSDEDVWRDSFVVVPAAVPSFVAADLVHTILVTGKSVHVLRQHGQCFSTSALARQLGDLAHAARQCWLEQLNCQLTRAAVERQLRPAAALVNRALLDECLLANCFLSHCAVIRDFVLFARSDFADNLLDATRKFFPRRAALLFGPELVLALEQALIDTVGSEAFSSPTSLFHHVNVRLVDPSASFVDAFCLVYSPPALLRPLFDADTLARYAAVCRLVWRLSRVYFAVAQAWKRGHSVLQRKLSLNVFPVKSSPVDRLLQRYVRRVSVRQHVLSCGLSTLRSYLMNQVVHPIFDRFQASVPRANDLDDLIATHRYYVASIYERCLLAASQQRLRHCLDDVFAVALELVACADRLHQLIVDRVHRSLTRTSPASASGDSLLDISLDASIRETDLPSPQEQAKIDQLTAKIDALEQQHDKARLLFNSLVDNTDLPTL